MSTEKMTEEQMAQELISLGLIDTEVDANGVTLYGITDKGMKELKKEIKHTFIISLRIAGMKEVSGKFDEALDAFEQMMIRDYECNPVWALMSLKYCGEDMLVQLAKDVEEGKFYD